MATNFHPVIVRSDPNNIVSANVLDTFYRKGESTYVISDATGKSTRLDFSIDEFMGQYNNPLYKGQPISFTANEETWIKVGGKDGSKTGWKFITSKSPVTVPKIVPPYIPPFRLGVYNNYPGTPSLLKSFIVSDGLLVDGLSGSLHPFNSSFSHEMVGELDPVTYLNLQFTTDDGRQDPILVTLPSSSFVVNPKFRHSERVESPVYSSNPMSASQNQFPMCAMYLPQVLETGSFMVPMEITFRSQSYSINFSVSQSRGSSKIVKNTLNTQTDVHQPALSIINNSIISEFEGVIGPAGYTFPLLVVCDDILPYTASISVSDSQSFGLMVNDRGSTVESSVNYQSTDFSLFVTSSLSAGIYTSSLIVSNNSNLETTEIPISVEISSASNQVFLSSDNRMTWNSSPTQSLHLTTTVNTDSGLYLTLYVTAPLAQANVVLSNPIYNSLFNSDNSYIPSEVDVAGPTNVYIGFDNVSQTGSFTGSLEFDVDSTHYKYTVNLNVVPKPNLLMHVGSQWIRPTVDGTISLSQLSTTTSNGQFHTVLPVRSTNDTIIFDAISLIDVGENFIGDTSMPYLYGEGSYTVGTESIDVMLSASSSALPCKISLRSQFGSDLDGSGSYNTIMNVIS